jgi:superfamily II DNA/RNA helicase
LIFLVGLVTNYTIPGPIIVGRTARAGSAEFLFSFTAESDVDIFKNIEEKKMDHRRWKEYLGVDGEGLNETAVLENVVEFLVPGSQHASC